MTVVVVRELPDLPAPKVNPVLPEMEVRLGLQAPPEPRVLRALMAHAALQERQALKARPALRELKVLPAGPEADNVFAPESTQSCDSVPAFRR